jgi:putative transposase
MPGRLRGWDYGAPGAYFFTVCTHRRRRQLGVVDGDRVSLSAVGRIVETCLLQTFDHAPALVLSASVVMPDHVHLIAQQNDVPPSRPPIDRLVGVFQGRATHAARQAGLVKPREPLWQRGYFDRIMRTQHEHAALIAYIETNPVRWTLRLPRAST